MTPLKAAKAAGFKNLAELSQVSGVAIRTLQDQFKNNPDKFQLALHAAIYRKEWKWIDDGPKGTVQRIEEMALPQGWTQYPSYGPYEWQFVHDNYDGAPDSDNDHLMVQADTIEEAVVLIKQMESE